MGQHTIYLSYAAADRMLCDRLDVALRGQGFDVWERPLSLDSEDAETALAEKRHWELRQRSAFLVVLSQAAFNCQVVREEIAMYQQLVARDSSRLILPLYTGAGDQPPLFLEPDGRHIANLAAAFGSTIVEIIQTLNSHAAQRYSTLAAPVEPQARRATSGVDAVVTSRISRRGLVVAGTGTLVALAACSFGPGGSVPTPPGPLPPTKGASHVSLKAAMWAHGTSAQVEFPERLRPNNPVRRQGWGTTFSGPSRAENWFHFAIPTPVILDDVRPAVGKIFVFYDTHGGGATLLDVHLYDGPFKFMEYSSLNLRGNHAQSIDAGNSWTVSPAHTILYGLGISVHVQFGQCIDSECDLLMTFTTVGADFHAS